ncbi:hypothetical protein CL653_02710 [bacterium]|nr:hypothetical protein [bacterium]|tara:strand:+ start:86 stop:454 length:369 start_codon:yes stop_codon:yes gene_type:complete
MKNLIKNNILLFTILPILILSIAASYLRFMVLYDYLVTYEGPCDPEVEVCFEYCETEECDDPFYYSWIEREASELIAICGELDILSCDASQECQISDKTCSISFCNSTVDTNCEDTGNNPAL